MTNHSGSLSHSRITEQINSVLNKHGIDIRILTSDLELDYSKQTIFWQNRGLRSLGQEDKISLYLMQNKFRTNQWKTRTFFHYIPRRFAQKIFEGNVRLYSLNKFLNQDSSEYKHFLKEYKIDLPKFNEQVNSIKDHVFIWCLTDLENSPKHWEEFARDDGVCLEVKLSILDDLDSSISFTEVVYNLDFLHEIQEVLYSNFELKLDIHRFHFFAKNYKNKTRFDWENEFRLSLDLNRLKVKYEFDNYLGKNTNREKQDLIFIQKTDETNGFKYLELPLENDFFKIEIINVRQGGYPSSLLP